MRDVSPLLTMLCAGLAAIASVRAQDAWTWPEHPKNLQVLSKEMTGQKLRPVMTGFTRALGVRCSYCHVGEEGKPLSTFDFASDANKNKDRAREMLRMLGDINDHLKKIESSGDKRVNMWCHTCHQGRPRPTTLEEELGDAYGKAGAKGAVARYEELKAKYDHRGAYDFGEESLNAFAYDLLGKKDTDAAITIFRLNTSAFPDSPNVWDSLAEAYATAGRSELAEIYYRRSLELNPDNKNAVEKLRELAGKPAKPD